MENYVCWKSADPSATEGEVLKIGDGVFTRVTPTALMLSNGKICLDVLYIERKYKTQVSTPDRPRPYYDYRIEEQTIPFDELVFNDDEICIGVYHEGLLFMIYDTSTHYREKYLGEMPTGPDQSISFYDYYYLRMR